MSSIKHLVLGKPRDVHDPKLFHNETATAIQRRLQWQGLPMVVLPVRVSG